MTLNPQVEALLAMMSAMPPVNYSTITPDALLQTIARRSGLPLDVIDDRKSLDLDARRAFFRKRVIGQDEAVEGGKLVGRAGKVLCLQQVHIRAGNASSAFDDVRTFSSGATRPSICRRI